MRVLIPDAGEPVPSFVRGLIEQLGAHDLDVDLTPIPAPGVVGRRLRQVGMSRPPASVRRSFRQADLIHFQWPATYLAYGPYARRLGKPTVLSLRGRLTNIVPHLPGKGAYREALRSALPLCDAFHCVSADVRDRAVPLGLDTDRAHVIRPAIDLAYFAPANVPRSSPLRVVMVGALMWRKGYEYALTALAGLKALGHDAALTIAGEGPDRERIERSASDLGIADDVVLAGSLERHAIQGLLHTSDVLLHTSLSEGIANSVLEAMACALPVVVWNSGGMAEAVDDGIEGRLIACRDVHETARALAALATEPALANEMGAAGRRRVERDFDLQSRGSQFLDLYRAALEGAPR